jgi:outer membrane protein assembly factor BamB
VGKPRDAQFRRGRHRLDDHLYGFDGGALKCIDLEGKACWESECTGDALSIADGRLIFVTVDGELVVAEASPAGYHELARKQVLDRGAFRTVPVLADGRIYVRSQIGEVVACDHRSD